MTSDTATCDVVIVDGALLACPCTCTMAPADDQRVLSHDEVSTVGGVRGAGEARARQLERDVMHAADVSG